MKKALKIAGKALLILLAAVILALFALLIIPLTETAGQETAPESEKWMDRLRDGVSLSELLIPGTHDSATEYVDLAFFSKCQAMDVGRQLRAGYRYLDIRLAADGERMKLMHGFVSCRESWLPWSEELYLDGVLDRKSVV